MFQLFSEVCLHILELVLIRDRPPVPPHSLTLCHLLVWWMELSRFKLGSNCCSLFPVSSRRRYRGTRTNTHIDFFSPFFVLQAGRNPFPKVSVEEIVQFGKPLEEFGDNYCFLRDCRRCRNIAGEGAQTCQGQILLWLTLCTEKSHCVDISFFFLQLSGFSRGRAGSGRDKVKPWRETRHPPWLLPSTENYLQPTLYDYYLWSSHRACRFGGKDCWSDRNLKEINLLNIRLHWFCSFIGVFKNWFGWTCTLSPADE